MRITYKSFVEAYNKSMEKCPIFQRKHFMFVHFSDICWYLNIRKPSEIKKLYEYILKLRMTKRIEITSGFDTHLVPKDAKNIKQTEMWRWYIIDRIHGFRPKTPKGLWKLMEIFRKYRIKNPFIRLEVEE